VPPAIPSISVLTDHASDRRALRDMRFPSVYPSVIVVQVRNFFPTLGELPTSTNPSVYPSVIVAQVRNFFPTLGKIPTGTNLSVYPSVILPIRRCTRRFLWHKSVMFFQLSVKYLIRDQIQCHRTLTQHQAILHRKDAGVQHPFQLYQQRNHFCSFCTYDSAARNDGDSKKKKLYPRLLA